MSCSLPRFEDPDDLFDAAFAIVIWLVCCMTAARSLCDADVSLLVRMSELLEPDDGWRSPPVHPYWIGW